MLQIPDVRVELEVPDQVVLPDGWLNDPYECADGVGADAELDTSGG